MAKKAAKWAVPLMTSAAIGAVVGGYAKELAGL
jgi:hypothetical protein